MGTALVHIESMAAVELFKPGVIDPILERIKVEAREEAAKLDISTDTNRKALASLAFKIARSKTFLEKQGKDLVADEKRRLASIDSERRRIWNELEALQDEVRQPLTEWEQRDQNRIAAHEAKIAEIVQLGQVPFGVTTADIEAALAKVSEIDPAQHEEFAKRVAGVQATAAANLRTQLTLSKQADADRAEMARLQAEAQERAIKEREEAAARAAKEEAERIAQVREEAARKAVEAERQRLENERIEAEARAKQAEARRIAEEQDAKRRAKEAAEQAKRDQERAVEAERQRIADEQRREREATEARERNKAHRAKINHKAKDAFIAAGMEGSVAELAVVAIAKGIIPHITINY